MYKKHEHIHFMGIGGIGVSGIAEILKLRGYTVSGCDLGGTGKTVDHLREIGCTVHQGHATEHVHDADVVVYSSAVKPTDPELVAAVAKGIPVIPRALMLAEIMRSKYSVAISGSHGKTTTTSLISHILIEAGKMPTVVVGGVLKNIANNAQLGAGEIFIAEADESDRSLLYLNPTMAVVTNIDAEHLDTYKDLDDVKATFKNFLARLPFYGKAFVCVDDAAVRSILPLQHIKTFRYGLSHDADMFADAIALEQTHSVFDVYINIIKSDSLEREKKLLGQVTLAIPGLHNVKNALAAIAVALEFETPFEVIARALSTFGGVERRFEFKGVCRGAEVYDDYGHHPTEIAVTLAVASKKAKENLHVVFQPHRFSRTQKLWNDFVQVFKQSGVAGYTIKSLIIADIYPASEDPIDGVSSAALVAEIKKQNPHIDVRHVPQHHEIIENVITLVQPDDLVLTLGAGKMNAVADKLVQKS